MICESMMSNDSDNMSFQETSSNDDEDVEVNQNNSQITNANAGLADVFQKILKTNKPKKKKTICLSRAKKLNDVQKKLQASEDYAEQNTNNDKQITEVSKIKAKYISLRKKPSVLDRSREKILQKIATKGVVQLFNAVAQQQSIINKNLESAGPLLRKQEEVIQNIDKRAFLDMLMGNTKSISVNDEIATKVEKSEDEGEDKIWRVLRDDFVMGAKLKDWDKKADDEDSSSGADDING